jgi:hypothetical protein
MTLDRKLGSSLTASCSSVHTWTRWSHWSLFKRRGTNFAGIRPIFSSSARICWHDLYDSPTRLQTSWIVHLLSPRITSHTLAVISGVVHVDGRPECVTSSTDSWPSLKCLNHSNVLAWLKARSPKHSVGLSCSFVELEAKFNASYLLLNSRHFYIHRRSWKWCKENNQNSGTREIIKPPVARMLVER